MNAFPDRPLASADDELGARLASALETGLSPLIADAASLRTGAKAGSRRIRRRRRVAAGALTVVVLGGLGALALPREQDGPPTPLPIATPSISHTGETHEPTMSATGTPSRMVSTPPATATPTSTASHTSTAAHSGRPTAEGTDAVAGAGRSPRATAANTPAATSTGLGYSMDKSTWTRQGAYTIGDWLVYTDTTEQPSVSDYIPAGGTWTEPVYAPLVPPDDGKETLGAWTEGLVAQRRWSVSGYPKVLDTFFMNATGWAPGYAVTRMREADSSSNIYQGSDTRNIHVLDGHYHYGVRGLVRVGDVIFGVWVPWQRNEPIEDAMKRTTELLDGIERIAKTRGVR